MFIHVFLCSVSLRQPRSNDTLLAMSIPSAQILVSNTTLQEKELGLLGEIAHLTTGVGNIPDKSGAL